MKRFFFAVHLSLFASFLAGSTSADDFEWTGAGSNNEWSLADNWQNNTPGGGSDSDGIPDADDNVVFPVGATTTDGEALSLTIGSGVTFNLAPGDLNIGAGTVTFIENDGLIDYVSSQSHQSIHLFGEVCLRGTGEVKLENFFQSQFIDGGNGLLVNESNLIRGAGWIDVSFVNESVVRAAGGELRFVDSCDNSKGMIEVLNSAILTGSETDPITGGTIACSFGSHLEGGFHDVTFEGSRALVDSDDVFFSGTIINNADIWFEPIGFRRLYIVGEVNLDGDGEIRLRDIGWIVSDGGDALLNINTSKLRGTGRIRVPVVNNCTVFPEDGTLLFDNFVDNSNGEIFIRSTGHLLAAEEGIHGGLIDGFPGSEISGSYFDIQFEGGSFVKDELEFTGNIENNGIIHVSLDDQLAINGTVNLLGDGQIRLFNQQSAKIVDGGGAILHNFENEIVGTGEVQVPVINESLINPSSNGALLWFQSTLDNSSGEILINSGARIRSSDTSPITGGLITGMDGSIEGAYRDNSFAGSVIIHSDVSFEGTMVNNASLVFRDNPGTVNNEFRIVGEVRLQGDGEVVLVNENRSKIVDGGSGSLTNEINTIRGTGEIVVPVINEGTILADHGTLKFSSDVHLEDESSNVAVLLNGSQFDQSGFLLFDQPLQLAGNVQILLGADFDADIGDTYVMMSAASLTGQFASVQTGLLQTEQFGYDFSVLNIGNDVVVTVTEKHLLGDVNLDGSVNLLDIGPFIDLVLSGEWQREADLNQDGIVDLLDVQPFVEIIIGG